MSSEFLYQEYEKCFDQLRYHDGAQFSILKYSVVLSSSTFAVLPVIYEILKKSGGQINVFFMIAMVCFFLFIGNLLFFMWMTRNRLYYIFCARQINAIRKYSLENEFPEFLSKNQMYLSSDLKAFKLMSTHTIMLVGIALFASIFAGMGIFFCFFRVSWSFFVGLLIMILTLLFAMLYLNKLGNVKNADQAIE